MTEKKDKIKIIERVYSLLGTLIVMFCIFMPIVYKNNIFIVNILIFILIGGLLYQFFNKIKENIVIVFLFFFLSLSYFLINPQDRFFSGAIIGIF